MGFLTSGKCPSNNSIMSPSKSVLMLIFDLSRLERLILKRIAGDFFDLESA